jgi:8-oxo-dGTP diphosphatase
MQLVANCIIRRGNQLLLLRKPRRGWWVAPGGKVEPGESISEALLREVEEETGVVVQSPVLRGLFTVVVEDNGRLIDHWLLFTFYAEEFTGEVLDDVAEGVLEWVDVQRLEHLPMAEGDRYFFAHALCSDELLQGKFVYTPDYKLLEWIPELAGCKQ